VAHLSRDFSSGVGSKPYPKILHEAVKGLFINRRHRQKKKFYNIDTRIASAQGAWPHHFYRRLHRMHDKVGTQGQCFVDCRTFDTFISQPERLTAGKSVQKYFYFAKLQSAKWRHSLDSAEATFSPEISKFQNLSVLKILQV